MVTTGQDERHAIRRIGGIGIRAVDADVAVDLVLSAIAARTGATFAFCNMHTFNVAARRPEVAAALAKATVFNDGIGMDIAGRILHGAPFPANLNGTDLTPAVLGALDRPCRVFLLGSAPGVAEEAGRILERRFPVVRIVGSHHGFFEPDEGAAIAAEIHRLDTDLLLVGMGNPAQELWAARHGAATHAVTMCIGAFLDFTAGRFTRAPRIVQRLRAEWIYRMALEPRRMVGRYLGGAVPFLSAVIRERLTGGVHR